MCTVIAANEIIIPDALLVEILSFLQNKSYLPVAHVSKRFRGAWNENHAAASLLMQYWCGIFTEDESLADMQPITESHSR